MSFLLTFAKISKLRQAYSALAQRRAANGQTNKQTDRQTNADHNTSHLYWKQSN